jgi:hypothetical protein
MQSVSLEPVDPRPQVTDQPATFYENVRLVPEGDWKDIDFIRAPKSPPEPEMVRDLRMDIQGACRVIGSFLKNSKLKRDEFLMMLHKTAHRGLCGSNLSIEDGRANLAELKQRLVKYAYDARSARLREFSLIALFISIPGLIIGSVLYYLSYRGLYLPSPPAGIFPPEIAIPIAALWIPAGACIGVGRSSRYGLNRFL